VIEGFDARTLRELFACIIRVGKIGGNRGCEKARAGRRGGDVDPNE